MKKFTTIITILIAIVTLAVFYKNSQEAKEFNVIRKITVINGNKDNVIYQTTGKMSIEQENNQLIVITVDEKGNHKKI